MTKIQPALTADGLSFFATEVNLGVKDLGLRLTIDGAVVDVCYEPSTSSDGVLNAEAVAAQGVRVHTTVTMVEGLNAVVLQHCIRNSTAQPIKLTASTGQFASTAVVLHGQGNWLGWDLRFCHTDNVRSERYPHCQMEYPYLRMLPPEPVLLGRGEDQAFPGLFIADQRSGHGMVFAAASQALNFTMFALRKRAFVNTSMFDEFAIVHDPGQADYFVVPAGGELALDGIFIQLTEHVVVEDAFVDYIDFLASRHSFRGPTTPLLRQAFHCTWNYGVFSDQSTASLMPTARFIAGNIQNITYFLMDAGYLTTENSNAFLDCFYPDPNQHVTVDKWPHGIRAYADEIRRLGLHPGIWWSPMVRVNSQLYTDHPDWFLHKADGSLYLIGTTDGYLDYTNPEALAYLDRTLAVILGEWGMDACKMDFWSQNFEDRHARLFDPSITSVQSRTRFFETVRKHLPADGVFMTCVATGMGNPFVGQWADTYRNTIDIGIGTWKEQVDNCSWALPTLFTEGRKTFLLNNDSVGIMREYPDYENYFRLTWSFMNMGMLETGGRMETWPEQFVQAMRKLTDRCDRGYRCHCPDERAFTGVPLPEVLYVDFPDGSPTRQAGVSQSIAFFNWTEEPRLITIRRECLGQSAPVQVENFWTGERETFAEEFISVRLEKRSALLYDVLAEEEEVHQ